jgi:hypothetical protein
MQHFLKEPINLNYADAGLLEQLNLLSPVQISNLLSYRKLLGNFISIYELQAIPAWNLQLNSAMTVIFLFPRESFMSALTLLIIILSIRLTKLIICIINLVCAGKRAGNYSIDYSYTYNRL